MEKILYWYHIKNEIKEYYGRKICCSTNNNRILLKLFNKLRHNHAWKGPGGPV